MRVLYKIFSMVAIVLGALTMIAGTIFCIVGFPAFSQMMAGTTAMVLAQGGEEAASNFALAAAGIIFLIPGILALAAGISGRRALKKGSYDAMAMICGITVFMLLFSMIFDGETSNALDFAVIVFFCIYIALGRYLESKDAGQSATTEAAAAGTAAAAAAAAADER